MIVTKSDFLLYFDAPVHLWASKHGFTTSQSLSDFDQHLIRQGYEVEGVAKKFLEENITSETKELLWQKTYSEGPYQIRTDAMIYDKEAKAYDLYEIKSKSETDEINLKDTTFQTLVLESQLPLRNKYIITLNKEYVRQGSLDISKLFSVELYDDEIDELRAEVLAERADALRVSQLESADSLEPCTKPKTCPCPAICHPDLPEYSIYDIAHFHKNKVKQLRDSQVLSIYDLPEDFKLSAKQRLHVGAAQSGEALIDRLAIAQELASFEYPYYFLDYETYNPALPQHDGYRPYQHMVFQYSLHIVSSDGEITHREYLNCENCDPSPELLTHLLQHIGDRGTVFVWNKTFEMSRNKEMAERYSNQTELLISLNNRIYDLGDPFKKDMYVHPGFKGSWSIKNVLPVLVPELSYNELEIAKGDTAMTAWWNMRTNVVDIDKKRVMENLLKYCELDTLAMVKIWSKLAEIIK